MSSHSDYPAAPETLIDDLPYSASLDEYRRWSVVLDRENMDASWSSARVARLSARA